jgi:choline dehydrogenase-like flavoprotein
MTLKYSTPSEYLDAVKGEDLVWPVRYDDMFPYADQNEDYWTGYFSSRAISKRMTREVQANMHA